MFKVASPLDYLLRLKFIRIYIISFPLAVSAKHRETKQYFTLYNTLDDTKQYLLKELSLLNSIYENYAE